MDNAKRFAAAVALLARAFNKEPDDLTFEAFRIGCEGMAIEDIENGVRRCIQTSRWMPSPAELCGRVSLRLPGRRRCVSCDLILAASSIPYGYCEKCWSRVLGAEERARAQEMQAPAGRKELMEP